MFPKVLTLSFQFKFSVFQSNGAGGMSLLERIAGIEAAVSNIIFAYLQNRLGILKILSKTNKLINT